MKKKPKKVVVKPHLPVPPGSRPHPDLKKERDKTICRKKIGVQNYA
jgi:hypothetical protein